MRALFLILLATLVLPPFVAAADESAPIAVIVPRDFTGREPGAQDLALIFKRKKLAWNDGTRIQPVNLPADHAARRLFSQRILKSTPEAQAQYWNEMYFQGLYPPHVVASSEAMLRYVADTAGAIGYVSACKLDTRVKAVLWIDADGVVSATAPALECGRK
ncbi:MAG: substrate-binding domain-containing protein [Methylobacillus sp.]|jgi:ABC-type phosphate transport system substrate-binding protein|nr:substrate-binding domain-containing protein [Methylobacillus sp.]